MDLLSGALARSTSLSPSIVAVAVSAAVIITGIGLAVLVAALLHRPIARRLSLLENALVAYGSGRTETRLSPSGNRRDELDQVFEAFNSMASHIEELEQDRQGRIESERALLADLAHDIYTPVTVLRGYAETLIERGERLDAAARQSIAAELLGQSLYVQAIVEDLLTLASERAAQLSLTCVPVALDPLFDALVDSFQPLATERGVTVIGDAGGAEAWADPVRLRQMLTNLIRNSLLHAGSASLIEIGASTDRSWVILWVDDDGPGVAEELRPQLFERHHRGHGRPGWGIGLSIVRTLAELHGGTVRYVPLPIGARFEIRLPGAPSAETMGLVAAEATTADEHLGEPARRSSPASSQASRTGSDDPGRASHGQPGRRRRQGGAGREARGRSRRRDHGTDSPG